MSSGSWSGFHSLLHQSLRSRSPQLKHQRILVAVSGGQDSVCLLQLLQDLVPQWGWQLAVGHCDHGWPTDVGIADQVAQLGEQYQLPFYLQRTENLPQTEAAARKWRYQALTAIAEEQQFPYVMTAHTLSDRAETLLFNLMRGSGSDGLQGMDWQRPLSPTVTLLRPLLFATRQQTRKFCQQNNLAIWEDVLNQSLKYRRNRIRQELLPYLQRHFNPQVERCLAQTVEILSAEVDYLQEEARRWLSKCSNGDRTEINREILQKAPLAIQRRAIRLFVQHHSSHAPSFEHIESVVMLLQAPNRSTSPTLPGNWALQVQGKVLRRKLLD